MAHVGDQRLCRPRAQAPRCPLGVFVDADDDLNAAAGARARAGQRAIDRRPHAHHVQPRSRRQALADLAHHLGLEADVAVGQQHHLTLRFAVERHQRLQHAGHHLGAAAGVERGQPLVGALFLLLVRRHRATLPPSRRIGELDHLQPVVRAQRVDQRRAHATDLRQRRPAHGARRIEQQNEIAGAAVRRLARRRHERHQPEGVRARRAIRRRAPDGDADADLGRGRGPAHDDIAIEARAALLPQLDGDAAGQWQHGQRVRRRIRPRARRQRIVNMQRQLDGDGQRRIGNRHHLARGIGHPPGLAQKARPHRRRKAPLPAAVFDPRQRLIDGELGDDLGAGRHVAQLLREQAGALLFDEPGRAPVEERLLEALARLPLLVDLTDHARRSPS